MRYRTRWPWSSARLFAYTLALALQQLGVLAWEIVLVGVAVAQYQRRQVFHNVDLSAVLDWDKTIKDGLILLGVAIYYTAIFLSITQGL